MRVLVVMNFGADETTPQRGRWVVDQVEALRASGLEVDLFSFPPGRSEYLPATRAIRRLLRRESYDLVHAHYGLAGWCAWLARARPLIVTFHGTDVRHRLVGPTSRMLTRRIELTAGVSRALFFPEAGRPGLPLREGHNAVLPCGGDLGRFTPRERHEARIRLGLDPGEPVLFFPADPSRPEKRFDRAREIADQTRARLLTGGSIPPEQMPDWINAANAVLVTSDYEGFGLACLESLACEVPVLSTPVGIAPHALDGLPGCHCDVFDPGVWAGRAAELLALTDPRTPGRNRAEALSAGRLAKRVAIAYEEILARDRTGRRGEKSGYETVSGGRFGNDGVIR